MVKITKALFLSFVLANSLEAAQPNNPTGLPMHEPTPMYQLQQFVTMQIYHAANFVRNFQNAGTIYMNYLKITGQSVSVDAHHVDRTLHKLTSLLDNLTLAVSQLNPNNEISIRNVMNTINSLQEAILMAQQLLPGLSLMGTPLRT